MQHKTAPRVSVPVSVHKENPCWNHGADCPERRPGCQGTCERRAAYQVKVQEALDALKKDASRKASLDRYEAAERRKNALGRPRRRK